MSLIVPLVAFLFAVLPQAAVAQTIASFEKHQYPNSGAVIGQADLNGDGHLDLIMSGSTAGQSFGVRLGNGDGTFKPQVDFSTGTGEFAQSVAAGDFTGDGKVDLAISTNNHALYLFRGNGDGTFQSPTKLIETGTQEVVAADANGDGRMDIVAHVFHDPPSIEMPVFLNNGNGTFTIISNSIPWDSEPGIDSPQAFFRGDFDGDGHVDVAIVGGVCGEGACTGSNASLYFGDGAGHFTYGNIRVGSGGSHDAYYDAVDVDGDGKDEIVIMRTRDTNTPPAVLVVSLSSTRQITYKETDLADDIRSGADFSHDYGNVADFNLDGVKDIVLAVDRSADGKPAYIMLPGKGDGTFGAPQYVSATVTGMPWAGDYNDDAKPDFLDVLYDNFKPATLQVMINTTEKGGSGCPLPDFDGIAVCSPQQGFTYDNPVSIKAASHLDSTIYRFELWVDNVKLVTVRDNNVMDTQVTLNPGMHTFVFVARNAAGTERYKKTVTASVAKPCGPRSTVGVSVCSPADVSTVSSPVNIEAYAKVNGTIYRFELWVDNVKKVTVRDSGTMKGSLTLTSGHHQLDFAARNTDGTSRANRTVFVTVQ